MEIVRAAIRTPVKKDKSVHFVWRAIWKGMEVVGSTHKEMDVVWSRNQKAQ